MLFLSLMLAAMFCLWRSQRIKERPLSGRDLRRYLQARPKVKKPKKPIVRDEGWFG